MRKLQLLLPMLLVALIGFAQQKIITGRVTNKTNNEPLPGVSVQAKNKAVTTDTSGKFSISASVGETINFSFVGMNPLTIKVTGASVLNLTMEEGNNDLNQVVVTGYKSEKKVDLTGSVSVVNLKDIKNTPASSPMLALQGQVPGLYVQPDGSPTGGNGGSPQILIRGANTLGNTSPLYIIDGVPTTRYEDFAALSPGSIASMQVLKDASAASIYGSRASNGVIIITTKDGSTPGQEKIHLQFSTSLTVQTEKPWQESVLSSDGRGRAIWQAAVNDSLDPNTILPNIYTFGWNGNYASPSLSKVNIAPYVGGDSLEPAANTNWQNELYKNALVTSNNLTVSAGTGKSGLLIDLGYYNNNGLIAYTNYQKYTARINSHTAAFNGRLKFGENLMLARTSQVNSITDVGGASTPSLAITLAPTIPLRKTNGKFGGPEGAGYSDRNNPVDMQYLNRWNTNNQFLTTGNVYAEIGILKNLAFRTSVGFDYSDQVVKTIHQVGDEGPIYSINSLNLQDTKELTFTWTNTLNYNVEFGKSRLNVLAGTEAIRDDYQTFGAYREGFAIQDVNYFQLGSAFGASTNNGSATGYRLLSEFGKAFYGYGDRYLASVTLRRDGSSRFGTNNQYGLFPAATIGWRINNEDFFKDISSVSNLKLRAGVGRVGNQSIGNLAAYGLIQANYGTNSNAWTNTGTAYDLYGANTGNLPSGYVQVQRQNPNLKWETTDETNVGLDFGFLHERFTGSFDYFSRHTTNILILPPVASAVGEGQQEWLNGASKSNKGWELALSYHNTIAGGLNYSISANMDHFADKITQLPADVRAAYPGDVQQTILGHSQYAIFGYQTVGIFKSQAEVSKAALQPGAGVGRLKYKDIYSDNGNAVPDGIIDANDQTWLGTTLPKIEYGIRLNLDYKNFDLSIFGSGVAGKKGFDPSKFSNSFIDTRTNYGPGVFNAWTPQNTGSATPALSILNRNGEDRTSDFFIVNASYFKLRNVQLGYNLPPSLIKVIKMEALRIYVMGQNLFALKSKQFQSKDPERTSFDLWPVPTSITFGLNVTF